MLQVVVLMESSTQMFRADTAAARSSHTRSPALLQDCVLLILSVHSDSDTLDASFPSMIRFSLTAAVRDVMDGRDR